MSDHGAIAEVHQYVHLGYTLTYRTGFGVFRRCVGWW